MAATESIIALLVWIGLIYLAAHAAGNRYRVKLGWGVGAAFFGIFALALLLILGQSKGGPRSVECC
jgi:hypothetical protein